MRTKPTKTLALIYILCCKTGNTGTLLILVKSAFEKAKQWSATIFYVRSKFNIHTKTLILMDTKLWDLSETLNEMLQMFQALHSINANTTTAPTY